MLTKLLRHNAITQIRKIIDKTLPADISPVIPLLLEEERAFFGSPPWPIGIAGNERNVEAMARWSFELGLTPRQLSIEELFPLA